jgi:BMFP domain-containing protein YqiC
MANYYNKYSDAEILAALDATGHDEMEAAAAILVSRGVEVDASSLFGNLKKKVLGKSQKSKLGEARTENAVLKARLEAMEKSRDSIDASSWLGGLKKKAFGQSMESKLGEARTENAVLKARIEAMEKKSKDVSGSARKPRY